MIRAVLRTAKVAALAVALPLVASKVEQATKAAIEGVKRRVARAR